MRSTKKSSLRSEKKRRGAACDRQREGEQREIIEEEQLEIIEREQFEIREEQLESREGEQLAITERYGIGKEEQLQFFFVYFALLFCKFLCF